MMFDRTPGHASRGQALPFVALAIVSLLGVSALVVDGSYWGYEQRMQQAAADSGAIAGANEIPYVTASPNPVYAMAQRDAGYNGYTNGTNGVSVTVNNPPLTGNYIGNTNAVEVIVARQQTNMFASIFAAFKRTPATVSGRAVALRGTVVRNCLIGLGSNYAITFNNATVNMPNCGIVSASSLTFNQSTVTAHTIQYNQSSNPPNLGGNTFPSGQPQPALIVPATLNPCSSIAGCAYLTSTPPPSGPCVKDPYGGYSNYNYTDAPGLTLPTGNYCGMVTINGGPYPVTFAPGLLNFENGLNDNGVPELDGNGVTLYTSGNITINGNPIMNLVAPSTGLYQGMLIYTTNSNFTINGGGNPAGGPNGSFAGMIYMPNNTFIIDGTLTTWALVVANQIILNSNSVVNVPSDAFPGQTLRPSALVE